MSCKMYKLGYKVVFCFFCNQKQSSWHTSLVVFRVTRGDPNKKRRILYATTSALRFL